MIARSVAMRAVDIPPRVRVLRDAQARARARHAMAFAREPPARRPHTRALDAKPRARASRMGVCVSVDTVERELEREDAVERELRARRARAARESRRDGSLILRGTLASADRVNRNGRVYPLGTLAREVASYEARRVRTGTAYGRLEHPWEGDAAAFRNADEDAETSHRVVELRWEGKELLGYVEVLLDKPAGRAVLAAYERGELLGASTRSWSGLERRADGKTYVDDDMELLAFDLVRNPSTISLHSHGLLVPTTADQYEWPRQAVK